jgi:uncharacterized OB-fold protein
MTDIAGRPEVDGLFTWPSTEPRLIAGRCSECDSYFFPSYAELHRPNCSGGPVEQTTLSRTGVVVSYTVQRYRPPEPFVAPDPFEPMPMATVAFPEGIQVPGMLTGIALTDLRVGIEVEVCAVPLYTDPAGVEALTYAFLPVATAADGHTRENGAQR